MITLNKVASLQQESQNALSIFEKTALKLRAINDKIAVAKAKRVEEVTKLNGEVEALSITSEKNAKLADKLASFLED